MSARPASPGGVTIATTLGLSLLTTAGSLAGLVQRAGEGRMRDLRIVRTLRYLFDVAGVDVLEHAPRFVHQQLDPSSSAEWAPLFAAGVVATLALLIVPAIVVAILARRGRLSIAAIPALLGLIPLLVGAHALIHSTKPWIAYFAAVGAAFLLFRIAKRWPDMTRVIVSSLAIVTLALLLVAACTMPYVIETHVDVAAEPGAPNVILISIDSLRADHLHAYGYPRATSPNLDRIASEGAVFENAIAPTSWTLPSHMSLLTALPPEGHGVTNQYMRLGCGTATIAERFHRAGYTTAGIVSAVYLDGQYGFSRGFDSYDDYSLFRISGRDAQGAVTSPELTRRADAWLRHRDATRPFFLFLHFWDVHYNYNPPAPFDRRFDPEYAGSADGDIHTLQPGLAPRDVAHVVSLYDGEIAWVDAHIGRLLTTLKQLGLDQNTIVAVTADHGEEFFDHGGRGHHNTLYDEVLHVPLLVRAPQRVTPGTRVAAQVRLMDVGPTLLTLAGLRPPIARRDGDAVSLLPLLRHDTHAPSLPAFAALEDSLASIRLKNAKLIVHLRTRREELYDLRKDPKEQHAAAAGDGVSAKELRDRLQRWRDSLSGDDAVGIDLDEEAKANLKSLGYLE